MTPMSDNKVLLVGAAGYIGSNCPFPVDKIDIKTGNDFFKLIPMQYDVIIFLAAKLDSSAQSYHYNMKLHQRLDKWMELYPETHVIYASSAAVYGEANYSHVESDMLDPINYYGRGKLAGEYHVREYDKHTVLRFGNVYGRMDGQDGHGVTEIFKAGGNDIYGTGQQIRDFVPVSKIWQVIELAIDYPSYWQGVFNVSLNKPTTINEWFKKHGTGKPDYHLAREGDIHTSMLNNAKMVNRMRQCQPK
jgi:nucleoside-diphosphate-sugar epimerase